MSGPNENTPRCGALKRYKGPNGEDLFCGSSAGAGTDHLGFGRCSRHAGNSPGVRKNAIALQVVSQAKRELKKLDIEPVNDPLTELARVTGEVVVWKDLMGRRVNEIAEAEWRYKDEKGAEQVRAELVLWERALDRCERFLTAMARLNIDERLARIDEKQAEIIIKAVQAVLRDMGLTLDEQETARRSLSRQLRITG
jgi:hypothetical protein